VRNLERTAFPRPRQVRARLEQHVKTHFASLNQPHTPQTRVPAFADDDVVVHGNAERRCDIDDRFRHLDVGLGRRRIAAGVVVDDAIAAAIAFNAL